MGWYLRKDWEGSEDGIDAVVVHSTTTPRGEGPDWGRDHHWRPLQDHGGFPRRRSKPVQLERFGTLPRTEVGKVKRVYERTDDNEPFGLRH